MTIPLLIVICLLLCGITAWLVINLRGMRRIQENTDTITRSMGNNRSNWIPVLGSEGVARVFLYIDAKLVQCLAKGWKIHAFAELSAYAERQGSKEGSVAVGHSPSLRGRLTHMATVHNDYERDTDPHIIFPKVQDRMIANEQIYVIDLLDGADNIYVRRFNETIDYLEVECRYVAPVDAVLQIREGLRKTQAERGIAAYSGSRKYTAIRAEFSINEGPEERTVVLRAPWGGSFIQSEPVAVDGKGMAECGCKPMRPGRTVRVTCVGTLNLENTDKSELIMEVMAIYDFIPMANHDAPVRWT